MDDNLEKVPTSDEINNRISKLKAETRPRVTSLKRRFSGMSLGLRVGTDFLSGVVIGGAIGRLIDVFFGLAPFGLIVFLLLGGAAGTLNVYRFAKEREAKMKKEQEVSTDEVDGGAI